MAEITVLIALTIDTAPGQPIDPDYYDATVAKWITTRLQEVIPAVPPEWQFVSATGVGSGVSAGPSLYEDRDDSGACLSLERDLERISHSASLELILSSLANVCYSVPGWASHADPLYRLATELPADSRRPPPEPEGAGPRPPAGGPPPLLPYTVLQRLYGEYDLVQVMAVDPVHAGEHALMQHLKIDTVSRIHREHGGHPLEYPPVRDHYLLLAILPGHHTAIAGHCTLDD